ncbi:pectate lyase, partial [Pseudoxanthomonas sp. SGD-10]
MSRLKFPVLLIGGLLFAFFGFSQQAQLPVYLDKNQKLAYTPDSLGNQIPDFSYSGYYGGDRALPDVAIKVIVPVAKGDATLRIQSAIDYVANLPQDKAGFRGTVLLEAGEYKVSGSLKLHSSGVVLRGSGFDKNPTVIVGTGRSRETLIQIGGKNDRVLSHKQHVTGKYIPVNSRKITIQNASHYRVGDHVLITRPSTKEWISALHTEHFGGGITSLGWKPGRNDISWDRTIVSVKGNEIEVDAPITTALDEKYGIATVEKYVWQGRVEHVGVENISLVSEFDRDNLKDEDHRWMAITVANAQNVWVRRMAFRHFAGSAVYINSSAKKVTVEDCLSTQPVSEIGGQRRYTFFTKGQQTLFQRLYAEHGYHDFAVGFMAAGPNAFVQCESVLPYSFSGAIDSWASGVLFDIVNVDGQKLSFANRGQDGQGAGWTAANSVFWQSTAGIVECYQPPTAQNWAFGTWAQFSGDGFWAKSNEHVKPRSLYYAQLVDRIGSAASQRTVLMEVPTEASSSPKVETAMELTMLAANPIQQLPDFIKAANSRQPLQTTAKGVKTIDQIGVKSPASPAKLPAMEVKNGWLVRGNEVLTGKETSVQWWSGSAKPYALDKMRPHITRFVPGETGLGLTDDLQEVASYMKKEGIVGINHNYGLWYDRRRDDHQRIRRIDGEVWPPFYELPFARSGQGTAWDGLSKYDLTKYNQFYWDRLKQFADLADTHGLVLLHQNYFQHNILEAGAHYADFPWRTANNINNTGFP